jgi:hypothetical protein
MESLKISDDFMIMQTDKNLGPAIIERTTYIKRAIDDHLSDESTYRHLSKMEADELIEFIILQLKTFLKDYEKALSKQDCTFLERSMKVDDPYSYFYILAKIHKTPWSTRPIVSACGGILHGIGRWVDKQLQPICKKLPSYVSSSFELKQQILNLSIKDLERASLFTADAVSMYTNIDTDHALTTIANFLRHSPYCRNISNPEPIIRGLEIIMRNNVFRFGDTYWVQISGTAMGTPPAPMYATLYYSIHELNFIPRFAQNIPFYKRYIDDCLGIWIPNKDPSIDERQWKEFQRTMEYGKLRWEVSTRQPNVPFLDLTLTLRGSKLNTRIYEKARNLYLYIPPHSAHPPGIIRGLIKGAITRIFRLTSDLPDCKKSIQEFFYRLCARGYRPEKLRPLSSDAIENVKKKRTETFEKRVFLHVPFHPCDPPSQAIQQIFKTTLLAPDNEPALYTLRNKDNAPVGINRLVVAYHRPRNLKSILTQRRFREKPGFPVSNFVPEDIL